MATGEVNIDALYDAQQTRGSRRRNYDFFEKNPTEYVKHEGEPPELDFNMNYLKQKGHQLGYNRKYFDPAAAKAMAYRNNWKYGQEDIDGNDIPDIYATDGDNNLMMFNGTFASKLDKPEHRKDVIDYYKNNNRYKRRQTDFTDYMVEQGKKEPKTAKQKITAKFRKTVRALAGDKYAAKQFNDLLFAVLTHATFGGFEDRRLSDEKSKLFATKGGKAMLDQTYQLIELSSTLQKDITDLLQLHLRYLERKVNATGQEMYEEMMKVARKINANPITQQEWLGFLFQVEDMKKRKKEMKLEKAMQDVDLDKD